MSDGSIERALLIDDDFSVRRTHVKMLERAGHSVVPAPSARHALELVERGLRASVIVTDLNMPEMNGIQFLRTVRRFDQDVPVIMCKSSAKGSRPAPSETRSKSSDRARCKGICSASPPLASLSPTGA